eukprot:Skav205616  [mRNA]  locus=scaffold1292:214118:223221:+ [translate_table: standard]
MVRCLKSPARKGLQLLPVAGYINLGRSDDLSTAEARTVEAMQQRAWQVLDEAWRLGVRYFEPWSRGWVGGQCAKGWDGAKDCARSYGRSEEFLSGWLRQKDLQKEDVAVGSKWGYRYTADWRVDTSGEPHEVKDHSLSHLESQQKETQGFLGDHLRLYQIHSATLDSGVLENEDVLKRLQALRDEKGWKIGLSLSGVGQSKTLTKALQTGVFDSVQATWNLMEQSCGAALQEAHDAGLKVIIKEGMANGRILRRPELLAAAEQMKVAPDALALAAIMAQPFEAMVLSGAVTREQLESNMEAVQLCERLKEARGEQERAGHHEVQLVGRLVADD